MCCPGYVATDVTCAACGRTLRLREWVEAGAWQRIGGAAERTRWRRLLRCLEAPARFCSEQCAEGGGAPGADPRGVAHDVAAVGQQPKRRASRPSAVIFAADGLSSRHLRRVLARVRQDLRAGSEP